jgi:hypothetical protein
MHPYRRRMGHSTVVALTHKNNRDNFSSYQGHPDSAYSQNHGAEFYSDRPHQVVARTQSYQYNCFWSISPTQRCCSYSQNHASDTGGGWAPFRLLLLHTRIIETTFFIVSGTQVRLCTHKNHGADFIRIGLKLLLVLTKLINTTVFGVSALQGVARTHKIMHPTPAADGPAFQIVALTQE